MWTHGAHLVLLGHYDEVGGVKRSKGVVLRADVGSASDVHRLLKVETKIYH